MTPKEKAKELVNKYFKIVDYSQILAKENAKQCALICVNEILSIPKIKFALNDGLEANKYWQEVKQEIDKL